MAELVQPEQIEQVILLIRGQRVMLDRDLAALYGVETGNLNKAVKRNPERFPADFMFQLTPEEAESLRFQFGSLKRGQHFQVERKFEGHETSIRTLFDAIRELAAPPARPSREIGFHIKEARVRYRVRRK
jgi:hypothetical protein